MSWLLCSSEQIIRKAGANASAAATASYQIVQGFYDEAEAVVNSKTRYDWTTNIGNVGTYFKQAVANAVSCHAAINVVSYDMSGYTSRLEAQTILDVLKDQFDNIIVDLREKAVQEKLVP